MQEADKRHTEFPDLTLYQIAQLILKEQGHDMTIEEIKRLLEIKDPETPTPPPLPNDYTIDYTRTSASKVYVIDKWFDRNPISNRLDWSDVKYLVYKYILEKGGTISLDGRKGVFSLIEPIRKQSTKSIGNGHFIDTGFNANTIVKHCREALASAGYDFQKDLIIEIDKMYEMKRK